MPTALPETKVKPTSALGNDVDRAGTMPQVRGPFVRPSNVSDLPRRSMVGA